MTSPPRQRRRSLEREIIIAVIVLYLMITGVMVTVHYTQPAGQGRQHHRRRRLTASNPAASQSRQSDPLNKEIDNDPHNAQGRRAASLRG